MQLAMGKYSSFGVQNRCIDAKACDPTLAVQPQVIVNPFSEQLR